MPILTFRDLAAPLDGVRYQINRVPQGLEITGKQRSPVLVTMERTQFQLRSEDQGARFGLFDYRVMIDWIAKAVTRQWGTISPWAERSGTPPKWIQVAAAKALNARVYPLWRELVNSADPSVVAVQRRMFSATFSSNRQIVVADELYRHPYIVADIGRYPAAAIAAASVDWMSLNVPWIAERYPYAAQRQRARDAWFPRLATTKPPELDAADPRNVAHFIELLKKWQALFSPTGKPYTSLNKTLMNLPGGITPDVLCGLRLLTLERPVLDRLELIAMSTAAQCRRRHHDPVYAHARHDEIVRGMGLVSEARSRAVGRHAPVAALGVLSPRRTKDIAFFTRYLSDFPDPHGGRIVALARKAVEWHETAATQSMLDALETLGAARATLTPPIPLPEIAGVTFLSTVGEILEEATRMGHCVASYARDAVQGRCYLFHVERGGEMATVEVDRIGRVLQAYGPGNSYNSAVSWGRETLAVWARPLGSTA